jgi:hypothetical protein
MSNTMFTEVRFWLMVLVSVVPPFGICALLLAKRSISRRSVLLLGFTLIAIAGLDAYFPQTVSAAARLTPSLADNALLISELSLALYLLPAMFGGIGVNHISHILISHLVEAEQRFLNEHPNAR